HCSNVVGHVNPVADIAAKAHAVGAHVVTDGVAYAPHGLPDIDELGVDVYLFSSYKTYGPHQGIMVVRSALRDQLVNQSHYFNAKLPHKKLTPAGPDHAQIAASAGMADYFDAIHDHHFSDNVPADERGRRIHTLFRQSEEKRLAPLLTWLDDQKSIELVGPADATIRAPTVAVVTKEKSAAFIARELAEHKVMAGNGNFYAVRVLDGLNIPLDPGVLRMSFVHYTTDAEVNQLIQALDTIL
ncbi:MAG: aminotransferase class V-fold PLP-dependent enzyme, partial [Chloroflexota bacterium]